MTSLLVQFHRQEFRGPSHCQLAQPPTRASFSQRGLVMDHVRSTHRQPNQGWGVAKQSSARAWLHPQRLPLGLESLQAAKCESSGLWCPSCSEEAPAKGKKLSPKCSSIPLLQIHCKQNKAGTGERAGLEALQGEQGEPCPCCVHAIRVVAQLLPPLTSPLGNLLLFLHLHGSALLILFPEANGISVSLHFN